MWKVQKDRNNSATYCPLKLIPLHSKWSRPAHLLKVKEPVLRAELHRSVRWHKQQRAFLEGSRQAFQREQQGMKHRERLSTYTCTLTLNTSGTDQFFYTKTHTKAEECRNVMFTLGAHANCLSYAYHSAFRGFFFFYSLILCPSLPPSRPAPGASSLHSASTAGSDQSHLSVLALSRVLMRNLWGCSWSLFVLKSGAVVLPSVRDLVTDSAAVMSSVPNFAQRRPPGLPV